MTEWSKEDHALFAIARDIAGRMATREEAAGAALAFAAMIARQDSDLWLELSAGLTAPDTKTDLAAVRAIIRRSKEAPDAG